MASGNVDTHAHARAHTRAFLLVVIHSPGLLMGTAMHPMFAKKWGA